MDVKTQFDRIEINPEIMTGKPVIKGTRLTVQFIIGLLAAGATVDDVLLEYSAIETEDILACLSFASLALDTSEFLPLTLNM
nr:DUF433 domain-containing protein [Bacteroidota bacterium]